jgi:hypothetical protein
MPREEHVEHYKDGSVKGRGLLVDGKMEGYWEWFRKDGSKMRSGHFSAGEQVMVVVMKVRIRLESTTSTEWIAFLLGQVNLPTRGRCAALSAATGTTSSWPHNVHGY